MFYIWLDSIISKGVMTFLSLLSNSVFSSFLSSHGICFFVCLFFPFSFFFFFFSEHLSLCLCLSPDPMDCHLSCFSIHGIFQARVLEFIAASSPGDLPDPGIESRSPPLQADTSRHFNLWATRKPKTQFKYLCSLLQCPNIKSVTLVLVPLKVLPMTPDNSDHSIWWCLFLFVSFVRLSSPWRFLFKSHYQAHSLP